MIISLLKFIVCSGVLLIVYHLLLKSKSTYRFNRFFLLASVVFSLLVPFITVKVHNDFIPIASPVNEKVVVVLENTIPTTAKQEVLTINNHVDYSSTIYTYIIMVSVYCLITGMLLFRFVKNIYQISRAASRNISIKYKEGYIVLLKQQLTPHTFFNRIFLNEEDYYRDTITNQVFQHELAHASQWHSADVIFIELVQALCWFNPFVPFYKKAIQLNHEFLADEAVLQNEIDITSYQYQLLNSAAGLKGFSVASQFNYSLTKKRLIMMTRKTSNLNAMLSKAVIITVMAIAFVAFCNAVNVSSLKQVANLKRVLTNVVQDTTKPDNFPKIIQTKYPEYPYSKEGVSEQLMNEYSTITQRQIAWLKTRRNAGESFSDTARLIAIFKHMSRDQQKNQHVVFEYNAMPLKFNRPTEAQFESLKNERLYGVWINEKHVKNVELNKYKASDFGQYWVSSLTKKAINYNKYKYQVGLMTVDFYKDYRKRAIANRYGSIMITRFNF